MNIPSKLGRDYYLFRFSSAPYLSGDGFRDLITTRVEGKQPDFRRASGSLVFCESDHVAEYLAWRRSNPSGDFVLVSGNGDVNFRENGAGLLPEALVHWYGQNILFRDERASPLPIGLEIGRAHV